MEVASSLPRAPRTKASRGVTRRRWERTSRSCSKIVYCSIGFMTRTRAGRTPAKRAVGPSVANRVRMVWRVEGFLGGGEDWTDGVGREEVGDWRAVMRVFMTQIGFVIRTVAEPARAPAIMDSMVVSFFEAREERMAARSKKARVRSYPGC